MSTPVPLGVAGGARTLSTRLAALCRLLVLACLSLRTADAACCTEGQTTTFGSGRLYNCGRSGGCQCQSPSSPVRNRRQGHLISGCACLTNYVAPDGSEWTYRIPSMCHSEECAIPTYAPYFGCACTPGMSTLRRRV